MTKFVKEIINDMNENPLNWKETGGTGVYKDNITVKHVFNGPLLSCCSLEINQKDIPITWLDSFHLEKCVLKWRKNIPLKHLTEN